MVNMDAIINGHFAGEEKSCTPLREGIVEMRQLRFRSERENEYEKMKKGIRCLKCGSTWQSWKGESKWDSLYTRSRISSNNLLKRGRKS